MNKNKISRITALTFCVLAMLLSACSSKDENAAEERMMAFAQHYFNLRYKQAATYCTEGSLKWLKYRAANINQSDLDFLNSQPDSAVCTIDDFSYEADSAKARISVKNFLKSDSVGKRGVVIDEQSFNIPMRRVGDKWLVQLDSLL